VQNATISKLKEENVKYVQIIKMQKTQFAFAIIILLMMEVLVVLNAQMVAINVNIIRNQKK
jgi:hypothetical protein